MPATATRHHAAHAALWATLHRIAADPPTPPGPVAHGRPADRLRSLDERLERMVAAELAGMAGLARRMGVGGR